MILGFLAQRFLQALNQTFEHNRLRPAQIDYFIAGILEVGSFLYTAHNVFDECVIALAAAITVNFDRLIVVDQIAEFMNGQFGPLSRPEDREEPQAYNFSPVVWCAVKHSASPATFDAA